MRALAAELDLPEPTSTAVEVDGMRPTPARDCGTLTDADRDRALHGLVDRDESPATVADRLDRPRDAVARVATWVEETAHKRRAPPTPAETEPSR